MSEEAGRDERSIDRSGERMEALTQEVLPALIARLGSSRLAELEVRADGWRVRLRRVARPAAAASDGRQITLAGAANGPEVARSPGVGYFSPSPLLLVGQAVSRGDRLGTVDVLGIEQEVSAPTDGVIGRIHAEPGQAVEYGQELASISLVGALPEESESSDEVEVEIIEERPVVD